MSAMASACLVGGDLDLRIRVRVWVVVVALLEHLEARQGCKGAGPRRYQADSASQRVARCGSHDSVLPTRTGATRMLYCSGWVGSRPAHPHNVATDCLGCCARQRGGLTFPGRQLLRNLAALLLPARLLLCLPLLDLNTDAWPTGVWRCATPTRTVYGAEPSVCLGLPQLWSSS
jgi:hypothetical protein